MRTAGNYHELSCDKLYGGRRMIFTFIVTKRVRYPEKKKKNKQNVKEKKTIIIIFFLSSRRVLSKGSAETILMNAAATFRGSDIFKRYYYNNTRDRQ